MKLSKADHKLAMTLNKHIISAARLISKETDEVILNCLYSIHHAMADDIRAIFEKYKTKKETSNA